MRKKRVGIDHWPKDTVAPTSQALPHRYRDVLQFAISGAPDLSLCGHGAACPPGFGGPASCLAGQTCANLLMALDATHET